MQVQLNYGEISMLHFIFIIHLLKCEIFLPYLTFEVIFFFTYFKDSIYTGCSKIDNSIAFAAVSEDETLTFRLPADNSSIFSAAIEQAIDHIEHVRYLRYIMFTDSLSLI